MQLQQQLQAIQQQARMQQEINKQAVEAAVSAMAKHQSGGSSISAKVEVSPQHSMAVFVRMLNCGYSK